LVTVAVEAGVEHKFFYAIVDPWILEVEVLWNDILGEI
jgi:hypothetical protein